MALWFDTLTGDSYDPQKQREANLREMIRRYEGRMVTARSINRKMRYVRKIEKWRLELMQIVLAR